VCVLYGDDNAGRSRELMILKQVSEWVKKHESPDVPLSSDVVHFSDYCFASVRRRNKYTYILGRTVIGIKFCATHELPLRG
jgi:hypothetical protein